MLTSLSHVNWLALLAATVAHFFLGGIWFTALFGRQYAKSLGLSDQKPSKPRLLMLAGPFLCSAVINMTTMILLNALNIGTYASAVSLGLTVGLGYLAAMTLNIAINPVFPHPIRYTVVCAPMFILGSLMTCVILFTFK